MLKLFHLSKRHFPRATTMARRSTDEDKSILKKVEAAQAAREQSYRQQEEMEMEKHMERAIKADPGYGIDEVRAKDSMNEIYSPYAQLAIPIDRVPEDIQKRMIKVLSKHKPAEVREWSRKLM